MDFEALVLLHKGYSDMTLLQWMSNLNKNEYICNKFQTIWEICTNEKTNPNPSLKSETQIQIQVSNLRHKSKPTTESKIQIQIWIPNLRNKFKAKFRIYEQIQIQIQIHKSEPNPNPNSKALAPNSNPIQDLLHPYEIRLFFYLFRHVTIINRQVMSIW